MVSCAPASSERITPVPARLALSVTVPASLLRLEASTGRIVATTRDRILGCACGSRIANLWAVDGRLTYEPVRDAALWKMLSRSSKLTFRNSPVGVVLRRPNGSEVVAKRGPNTVTITGEPGELVLFLSGRDQVRLDFDGEQAAVARVQGLDRGV